MIGFWTVVLALAFVVTAFLMAFCAFVVGIWVGRRLPSRVHRQERSDWIRMDL